jgi:3',5'-cyclic AMP phosphodiesterase CpdA
MRTNEIRIAVISDLHAVTGTPGTVTRSHLNSSDPEEFPSRQPIAGLLKLIDDKSLQADLLICPGDLGDLANPDGIRYAWDAVHRVATKLGGSLIVTTTGNHDVDSRKLYNAYDPIEVLKDLSPPYPLSTSDLNGQYWMNHFAVCEGESHRVLCLNSSAFHTNSPEEQEHGRISRSTIQRFRKYLEASTPKLLNVAVCHHHPQQHSELHLGDYDWMREGQELLDLLGCGLFGNWLFIHGHKHHPKITYAAGGVVSAVVFSAGSFSAALYPELGTAARNQFYVLTLEFPWLEKYGLAGRGQAWDWASSEGWLPASAGSGLPAAFGFGIRSELNSICQRVSAGMASKEMASWDHLATAVPELNFLIPIDLRALNHALSIQFHIEILFDKFDRPYQLGRLRSDSETT